MANVTIRDVAKDAGVSTATVSRVVNNCSTVNEALRERVNISIKKLGYYPNSIARTLKSNSSKTVGFVVSDIANDFFAGMVRSVEDVLSKSGYNLIVCSTDSNQQREKDYLYLLQEKKVDGIIINISGKNDELITEMSQRLPIVLFSRKIKNPSFKGDFVDNDNYTGIALLTKHLLSLGHKKIGLLNGQPYVSSAAERYEAFCSTMEGADIRINEDYPYIYNGNFNRIGTGVSGAKELFERGATAILATNNILALGALQFCRGANIDVPSQLSLASFGKICNYEYLYIQPSYVDLFPAAMGTRLSELMIERIESKNSLLNREVRFPTALVAGSGASMLYQEA